MKALHVTVVYATAEVASTVELKLADGATLGDALDASGLLDQAPEREALRFAVFGKRRERAHVLQEGDRVEILRPLVLTPNEARLLRAATRGARRAQRQR